MLQPCRLEAHLALFCNICCFILFCFFQNEDLEKQVETAKEEEKAMLEIFAQERKCRDEEVENLKKKLKVGSWYRNLQLESALFTLCALHLWIQMEVLHDYLNQQSAILISSVKYVGGRLHHTGSDGAAQCCPELWQTMKEQQTHDRPTEVSALARYRQVLARVGASLFQMARAGAPPGSQ